MAEEQTNERRIRRLLVLEEWNRYIAAVYHMHLEREQANQLRMAFFGGAAAALKLLLKKLSPGEEPTEADLELVRDVRDELLAFAAENKRQSVI